MAENIMLFWRIHFANFFFIMLLILIVKHPSALVAWEHALPCSVCCDIIATLHSAMAALVSITLLSRLFTDSSPVLRRLPDCFPRYFLHLCYDWSLCLAQLTPTYGVTSMSFLPGCHRPFCRSACLCSLPLLSWVSLIFIVWFLTFLLLPTSTICFSMFSLQPS